MARETITTLSAKVAVLRQQLDALRTLFAGVERVTSNDGRVQGLYFPLRVGIQTRWPLTQPMGKGNALSVTSSVDDVVMLIQHDGAEGSNGIGSDSPVDRLCLKVLNTDPHTTAEGKNRGIAVVTANAAENVAIDAYSQYSTKTGDVRIVQQTVWHNE